MTDSQATAWIVGGCAIAGQIVSSLLSRRRHLHNACEIKKVHRIVNSERKLLLKKIESFKKRRVTKRIK